MRSSMPSNSGKCSNKYAKCTQIYIWRAICRPVCLCSIRMVKPTYIIRFAHAWDTYLLYAFPGDELKPLSQTATNSLGELGNLDLQHLTDAYQGVALTAIDALSTLAIMGNWTEFERMTYWIADNVCAC